MSDPNSNIDPLTGQLEQLRHALTTQQQTAQTVNGAIRVSCTADGLIHDWHVAESLRNANINDVVATIVRLQHQATEAARSALAEATDQLQNDPRILQNIDSLSTAIATEPAQPRHNQRPAPAPESDDDAYFANQSFLEDPAAKQERPR